MKNIRFFYRKIFIFFLVVKFSMYLNRHVFVMYTVCMCIYYIYLRNYFVIYILDPIYTGLVTMLQVLYLLETCCRG